MARRKKSKSRLHRRNRSVKLDHTLALTYEQFSRRKGDCCWAMGFAVMIEHLLEISNQHYPKLKHADYKVSAQHIMDKFLGELKETEGGTYVTPARVIEFIVDSGGICFERDYPFKGKRDVNTPIPKEVPRVSLTDDDVRFLELKGKKKKEPPTFDEIKEILQDHPIAAPMRIYESFLSHDHKGGRVYTDNSGKYRGRHLMLIVGYGGAENGEPFFHVLNPSWGPDWGDGGYCRISTKLIRPLVYCIFHQGEGSSVTEHG